MERIERGELVGYVIIVVGLIGALAAVYQFIYLFRTRLSIKRQLANLARPTHDNPLGRVLLAFKGDPTRIEEDAEVAELRISEAVLREVPRARTLPGVPAPGGGRRPAARSGRHGHRHDHHLPEHHRVGLERSEADGARHRPGDDRDGARPRHRHPAPVRQRRAGGAVARRSCRSSTSRAPACWPRASRQRKPRRVHSVAA